MTTPSADRVILDTNVLLTATDTGRAGHEQARAALDLWPAAGVTLYCTGQILREYLAVATRPAAGNGLGLDRVDAVANVQALRTRLRFLGEDEKVAAHLLDLVRDVDCGGRQVHDANIVATMLTHGVETLVTLNVDDFVRFAPRIMTVHLLS